MMICYILKRIVKLPKKFIFQTALRFSKRIITIIIIIIFCIIGASRFTKILLKFSLANQELNRGGSFNILLEKEKKKN